MEVKTLRVPKRSGTLADALLAYGLARFLGAMAEGSAVRVRDEGLCRVGWSTLSAKLDLGTCRGGYGFGGTYGKYARFMSKYLPRHIPGKPNVIVQSIMDASTQMGRNIESVTRLTEEASEVERNIGQVKDDMVVSVEKIRRTRSVIQEASESMKHFIAMMEKIRHISEGNKERIFTAEASVGQVEKTTDELVGSLKAFKI
jgi:hypothetical protein